MKLGIKGSSYHGGLQRKLLSVTLAICFLSDSLGSVALLIVHQSYSIAFNLPGDITGFCDLVIRNNVCVRNAASRYVLLLHAF